MTSRFDSPGVRGEIPQIAAAILFAAAMGLLEAICVIYIRDIILPSGYNLSYPIAPIENLPYELIREACTIVMLLTAAWLAGFNIRSRLFYFFIMFGVWDILYYAGLKLWLDWPATWQTWDCLFLIPEPWYGPVQAPILISIYFIVGGILLLMVERLVKHARLPLITVLLNLAAFAVWYWSFVKDSSAIHSEGYAGITYSWILFMAALILGNAGIIYSVIRNYNTPFGRN